MAKFEIHLSSGKVVTVEASNKTEASNRAVKEKLLTVEDFYDVVDIIQIGGQVPVSEEIKQDTKHKSDKPKFNYPVGGNWR